MADELKPCPDGHKDVYLWESKRAHDGAPQWDVVCGGQDCEWALWGFLDRDSVVRQWNARAAAPADASLIDRLHTAEAEVAILRSFKAGVPWESLYRVAQYEEGGQWSAHNECVQAWIAANRPQEATE